MTDGIDEGFHFPVGRFQLVHGLFAVADVTNRFDGADKISVPVKESRGCGPDIGPISAINGWQVLLHELPVFANDVVLGLFFQIGGFDQVKQNWAPLSVNGMA